MGQKPWYGSGGMILHNIEKPILPDALLYDIGNVLEGRRKVLEPVVAQRDVVGQVSVMAEYLMSRLKYPIK